MLTFQDGVYVRWALNSVFYAVVTSVGAAFLATAAGYAFAKYKFPGGTALFAIILGAIMVPLAALTVPTYLLFARAQLTDTYLAVILPSLVTPFGVFLMRVYAADAVDDSLLEAGRVDGVGELRIFFTIGLRLLLPGSITVLLFALVASWNNYFLPLIMLNSPEKFPLPVGLAQWQSTATGGSGSQALFSTVITGSLLSIIPLVIAFLFLLALLAVRAGSRWRQGLSRKDTLRHGHPPPTGAVRRRLLPRVPADPRLDTDLDLMVEAGFSVIRVGESVWTTWEPEEGRFDLDWLQPVLDGAHARGIKVILGTPTYAAPPWLARRYPEIAGETRHRATDAVGRPAGDRLHPSGVPVPRRAGDPQIVSRYADHPAIIGFQVDNEPGMLLFHNHGVFQRFVDELRHTLRHRRAAQRGLGARLLVTQASAPGPTCGYRTATGSPSTTSPGVRSRPS